MLNSRLVISSLLAKSMVAQFSRSDGSVVQAHDNGKSAAAPKSSGIEKMKQPNAAQPASKLSFKKDNSVDGKLFDNHKVFLGGEHRYTVGRDSTNKKSGYSVFNKKDTSKSVSKHESKDAAFAHIESMHGDEAKPKKDIGAGVWNVGHKVKLHAPGHPLHGKTHTITGRTEGSRGFVNAKDEKGADVALNSSDLRPATGHSWPDLDSGAQSMHKKE